MKNGKFAYLFVLLILFSSGYLLRLKQELKRFEKFSQIKENEVVNYTGFVLEQPYQRGSKQVIVVENFRLYIGPFEEVKLGDKVAFSGRVDKRLIRFKTPTFYLYEAEINKISIGDSKSVFGFWYWWGRIGLISERMELIFAKFLGEPHASLLAGIVLGVRKNMPADFYEILVASGTLHVIAASGFNITIIAKLLLELLTRLMKRQVAVIFAILGIGFYTLLAGASPAVVRAAIMGGLAFVAQALGREYLAKWSLFVSSGIMLLFEPLMLGNVSYQLSVAATAGILWLQPGIEKWFKGVNKVLKQDLSTTLAATIGVLPITLITFDRLSIVSPIVNAFVLWLVPVIMALGGMMIVGGLIWQGLAQVLAWLVWPILELFIRVVSWFGGLGFASVEVKGMSWVFGVGYYITLISVIKLKTQSEKLKTTT